MWQWLLRIFRKIGNFVVSCWQTVVNAVGMTIEMLRNIFVRAYDMVKQWLTRLFGCAGNVPHRLREVSDTPDGASEWLKNVTGECSRSGAGQVPPNSEEVVAGPSVDTFNRVTAEVSNAGNEGPVWLENVVEGAKRNSCAAKASVVQTATQALESAANAAKQAFDGLTDVQLMWLLVGITANLEKIAGLPNDHED